MPLWAHLGTPATPDTWPLAWNLDPVVLGNLTLLSLLYGLGLRRMPRAVPWWRPVAFAGGVAAVLLALVSPLDAVSEQLGWAHMVQHTVLMLVAAPLFMVSAPLRPLLWGLPLSWRRGLSRARRLPGWRAVEWALALPLVGWALHAVTLWAWHLPALYEAALRDPLVHDVQHLSFFITACVFWRVVLGPDGGGRLDGPSAALYLFTTTLHATVLGAMMALSPRVWYPLYEGRTGPWGLTALEDQQIAGLIMWMPACSVYAALAAAVLMVWLERPRRPITGGAM